MYTVKLQSVADSGHPTILDNEHHKNILWTTSDLSTLVIREKLKILNCKKVDIFTKDVKHLYVLAV